MRTLEELKIFYETELMSEIEVLESDRKRVVFKAYIIISMIAVIALCLAIFLLLNGVMASRNGMQIVLYIVGGAVILSGGAVHLLSKGYTNDFKEKIILRIVRFIDEGLNYQAKGKVSQNLYDASEIFTHYVERYNGDDLVEGRIGDTSIQFSELHTEYSVSTKNGRRWHTIFKGLFFVADFNKDFKGRTFVFPDFAEKNFGIIGSMLQSKNIARPPLVKLEDPEFEKLFVVYGDDQIESRYILSTSLMRRIVEFKRKSKRAIRLAFVASKLYVAISYYKNLFEPRIFRTLLDFKPIQEYYEDLQLAIGIVDELNLNLRIWSK